MIRYKGDILGRLKDKGYSTYKIKEDKIFNQSQVQQIRNDKLLTQDALNKLCRLLECQPGDLLEYMEDVEQENDKE